jgi:hypothetical protein
MGDPTTCGKPQWFVGFRNQSYKESQLWETRRFGKLGLVRYKIFWRSSMSLAVLSFQIANDASFRTKLEANFSEVLDQQGIQLSTVEENLLKAAMLERKIAPNIDPQVEPWAVA